MRLFEYLCQFYIIKTTIVGKSIYYRIDASVIFVTAKVVFKSSFHAFSIYCLCHVAED